MIVRQSAGRIDMKRRPSVRKEWIPVTSADGTNHGCYEVSDGTLTVRLGKHEKSVRASSTGVPAAFGAHADRSLAELVLSELA
jgi:hypothetical protein